MTARTALCAGCALLAAMLMPAGCVDRAVGAQSDARHFFKATPEEARLLEESVRREVEHAMAEIEGPLRAEIADYLEFQIAQVGPLMYCTRDYAEAQISRARNELPAAITACLREQLVARSRDLVKEGDRFIRIPIEEQVPRLHEEFGKFLAVRRVEVQRFADAVTRYERVNLDLVQNLSIDVHSFLAWQVENAKAIPPTGDRYIAKAAEDFSALTGDTGRMFKYNLSEKPVLMADSVLKFAKYNTEEMLARLSAASGRYLWTNLDEVPDLVKEMYCFTDKNIAATGRLINAAQDYFSVQAERARVLDKEFFRFLEWRVQEWSDMKYELDRYISSNVANLEEFKKAPARYLEHQKEEWDLLMKSVPDYFISNLDRSEGLALALRRYIGYNTGHPSHNH